MFNKNVAIAYPNFKFSFTIWMLGRAHRYLQELREKTDGVTVNGKGKANGNGHVANGNGHIANGNDSAVASN